MRPIDAAIKDLEMIGDCRTCGNKTPFCDSNPDSCSGYKWRGVPPDAADDNQPLTLKELREMDGEPVWVVCTPDSDGEHLIMCALVSVDRENDEIFLLNSIGGSSSYEEACADIEVIYRRKPEKGMK